MKLIYMEKGFGWTTANGITFTRLHPYQLVDEAEAKILLEISDRFKEADKDELIDFYKLDKENYV
jgi:hypothetical protein